MLSQIFFLALVLFSSVMSQDPPTKPRTMEPRPFPTILAESGKLRPQYPGSGMEYVDYLFTLNTTHPYQLDNNGTLINLAPQSKQPKVESCNLGTPYTVATFQLLFGVLLDRAGRIGGIVANHQFQFDGPPSQAGTIYNGGWNIMTDAVDNKWLAIGNNSVFWSCNSGSFDNLYDEKIGGQCRPVRLDISTCGT